MMVCGVNGSILGKSSQDGIMVSRVRDCLATGARVQRQALP